MLPSGHPLAHPPAHQLAHRQAGRSAASRDLDQVTDKPLGANLLEHRDSARLLEAQEADYLGFPVWEAEQPMQVE